MKYIIWIISIINVYLGIKAFLNVIHVLEDSKYSPGATAVFAILFLGLGVMGFYFSLIKMNYKLGLIISVGPWILGLIFLFIIMITSDYN
ncbi:MAG: hypothetical protein HOP11_08740 [Saprospiraceae bacterium]|nr:hypothetical protein [Saprospiraceae bacterium]